LIKTGLIFENDYKIVYEEVQRQSYSKVKYRAQKNICEN